MPGPFTLTDNQRRQLDTYDPALSKNPPGADLVSLLENLGKIITGSATVLSGNTTVVVAGVGDDFNGAPVIVQFAEAPTAADLDIWGAVANGDLTITISANNTADLDVFYLIDGRSTTL